jgi:hypothetical protein
MDASFGPKVLNKTLGLLVQSNDEELIHSIEGVAASQPTPQSAYPGMK